MQLARSYIDLMRYKTNNFDYVSNLENSMMKINDNFTNMMKVIDKELDKYNMSAVETYNCKKKIQANHKKLQIAYSSVYLIKVIFTDINTTIREFISVRFQSKEDIMRIEEVGIDSHKKVRFC